MKMFTPVFEKLNYHSFSDDTTVEIFFFLNIVEIFSEIFSSSLDNFHIIRENYIRLNERRIKRSEKVNIAKRYFLTKLWNDEALHE